MLLRFHGSAEVTPEGQGLWLRGYRIIRIQGGKDESLVIRDWNRASKKARITLTNFAAYVLRLFAKESCLLEISEMYVYIAANVQLKLN